MMQDEDLVMPNAGPVLRQLRNRVGLTLEDAARRLGWDISTLSRYETGERTLHLSDIISLAGVFDLDPSSVVVECLKDRYPSLRKRGNQNAQFLEEMIIYLRGGGKKKKS